MWLEKHWPWFVGGSALSVGAILLLWPKKAAASTTSPSRAPQQKTISLPNGDGDSLSIALGDRVLVDLSSVPLPAGYQWAQYYEGDYVADIAHLGGPSQLTVAPRNKGNDLISFAAWQYDAQGYPTMANPIGPHHFYLSVH